MQTLQSSAALAEDLATGTASKQQAEELGRLLQQRGAKLPTLNSSPQVRGFLCLPSSGGVVA